MFRENYTNQQLIDLTLQDFRYAHGACEAEKFRGSFLHLIRTLDPESDSFETEWKHLMLGAMVLDIVIFSDKYSYNDYPYQMITLMKICEVKSFPDLYACRVDLPHDNEAVKLTKSIGRMILEKKLPFTAKHFNTILFKQDSQLKVILWDLINEYDLVDANVPLINSDDLPRAPRLQVHDGSRVQVPLESKSEVDVSNKRTPSPDRFFSSSVVDTNKDEDPEEKFDHRSKKNGSCCVCQ